LGQNNKQRVVIKERDIQLKLGRGRANAGPRCNKL
ncbi:hypothetical protein LINPERPRIM_LOCUS19231, partial [Linum perenne]